MAPVDARDVIIDVRLGKYDDVLSELKDVVAERINDTRESKLNMHTRVRFNNRVSPKYMTGQTGTIVGWKRTRVLVELDEPERAGRFARNSGPLSCPTSILDPI